MNTTQGHNGHEPGKTPGKAALASWIGSVLEYYDFFIYGTAAALVFGKVFFPDTDPATGTLLSFATYGVGYVARPIGAFFMGHIGDKYGRKRVLVLTVSLMGTATFLVGCLPSYDSIGIWAPILLVCLRLLQGFSASGEQSGANSLSLEHAPEHRRGYFTSFTLGGTQAGLIIATAIFLPIGAMPEDQLLSWGWRIPFWLSAIVVAVALVIRRKLEEPPAFREEAAEAAIEKIPTAALFRDHWPAVLRIALAALASTVSTIFAVYALNFAVDTKGLDQTTMLWVAIVTNVVALAAIPAWAMLSDRIGRKPVFIFGAIGSGALMFAYLGAIDNGSYPLIFVAAACTQLKDDHAELLRKTRMRSRHFHSDAGKCGFQSQARLDANEHQIERVGEAVDEIPLPPVGASADVDVRQIEPQRRGSDQADVQLDDAGAGPVQPEKGENEQWQGDN